MQTSELTKLMAVIATEYPRNFDVTKERVLLWNTILGHASYQETSKALCELLAEARPFPPVVGEINQKILANRRQSAMDARRLESTQKLLDEPPLSEEEREATRKKLKNLIGDLANKKAMKVGIK